MAKRTRITLLKSQAESAEGSALLNVMVDISHDGRLELVEVRELHALLRKMSDDIPAVPFLRAIAREILEDGEVDALEEYRLKQAMMRVAPKAIRGIIATHLDGIEMPEDADPWDRSQRWRDDAATSRQLEFITELGGRPSRKMTKGEASDLIESLLERKPPSPRQIMLLRFFDRTDLQSRTRNEVSEWIDGFFAEDYGREAAWLAFKRDTNQDPHELDPMSVPVGGYRRYVSGSRQPSGRAGCGSVCLLLGTSAVALLMAF